MRKSQDFGPQSASADDVSVPILEETATVSTRDVVTGRVRVSTHAEIVTELAEATLESDVIEVTRVKVERQVDAPPQVRTEGEVTIVPVLEEVLVIEKKLFLREEIHIRRRTTQEHVETPIELRRQRAVVERFDEAGQPLSTQEHDQ